MKKILKELLLGIEIKKIYGSDDIKVTGIYDDSRKIKKGGVFIAIKGDHVDGHDFIHKAIDKGATVIVGEIEPDGHWLKNSVYVKVKNTREVLGPIAASWYGNPARKLHVIGVTGTDGKTTTSTMICHILKNSGKKVGLLTTVAAKIGGEEIDTGLHVTNPESIELQRYLSEMVKKNLNYVVLEVTSHGLDQGRVYGVDFETAVLTNITHEHLDYHKTKQKYFEAKLKLFKMVKNFAVINNDCPYSKKIIDRLSKDVDVITYAIQNNAQVTGSEYKKIGKYYTFKVSYKENTSDVKLRIPGEFNMENALAAISASFAYGVSLDECAKFLRSFSGVKGRMHEVKNKKGLKIYVDFAHTPNGIEQSLKFLKGSKRGRLISVFGCAGERDVEKRILMPKTSVKLSEISIFTAEDPRHEDVNDILATMEKAAVDEGATQYDEMFRCLDNGTGEKRNKKQRENKKRFYKLVTERGEAISYAINEVAQSGDTVAIFGKGHEKSMAYNGKEYQWSDFDAVKMALKGKVKVIKKR
ncbi:UDP-N-acetylmuramoyl-L-alanyl-D-glutamate--2,6-diaminopimelate ligase [Candidatus Woesebacteria bacterium]|nr:UDP-N-acetylmuramoyl-L-alanyl-D-glutamate--2,6-diaminopimelate ligase [Candidatus Woesebacteria bacterium]